MKIKKYLVLSLLIIGLLSITVASQISQLENNNQFPESEKRSKFTQATDKISLEEKQDCTITYYNESVDVYGYVPRFREIYGICFNEANQSNYTCTTGTEDYQSYEVIGPPNKFGLGGPGEARQIGPNTIERVRLDVPHSGYKYSHWNREIYQVDNLAQVVTNEQGQIKPIANYHELINPPLPPEAWP